MFVSFVLRLSSRELGWGELTGSVEDVSTGRVAPIRGVADLVAFVTDTARPTAPAPRAGRDDTPEPNRSEG